MRIMRVAIAVVWIITGFASAQTPTPVPGDINRDGIVDYEDLMLLQAEWHEEGGLPRSPTPTETPLPTATPGDSSEITVNLPELPGDAKPLVLVRIAAGAFLMGSSDSWATSMEQPVHEVTIGYDFYIGKCEITQAQWLAVMDTWPGTEPAGLTGLGDDYPAYYVSWNDCQAFVDALNQLGQGTFRLPSEAEWEYACRGSASNPERYARYYFGDSDCAQIGTASCQLDDYAWWASTALPPQYGTKEVGQLIPNDLELYDMHGNVFEWCEDYWHEGYEGAPADGSAWLSPQAPERVIRGGAWHLDAPFHRSAYRRLWSPGERHNYIGFRIVREP